MSSSTSAVPQQPSYADTYNQWASTVPTQMQIAQQYEPQMAQLNQQIQQQLYPQTAGLQEQIAGQAAQGMSSAMPSWMQSQNRSNIMSQLGNNAYSGVGADYASRGMMQQQQDWQRYYQNLGLSAAGRQPLTNPQAGYGQTSADASTNLAGQTYGAYANNVTQMAQYNPWMSLAGSALGGITGAMTAAAL